VCQGSARLFLRTLHHSNLIQSGLPLCLTPYGDLNLEQVSPILPEVRITLLRGLGGSSVLRLTNILNNAQRVGLSTSETFAANRPIRYEILFNTLTLSPSTSIDKFIGIWLIDAEDYSRYDKVALSAPRYGKERVFTADSSISNTGIDTDGVNLDFTFSSNTWYSLVLEGSPNQDVTAILYDDSGKSILMRADLQHTLTAFPAGFRIGLSQSMGLPGAPRPTDVAINWVKLRVE